MEAVLRWVVTSHMHTKAYVRLGSSQGSLGEWAKAVEAYERAMELEPSNAATSQALSSAKAKVWRCLKLFPTSVCVHTSAHSQSFLIEVL